MQYRRILVQEARVRQLQVRRAQLRRQRPPRPRQPQPRWTIRVRCRPRRRPRGWRNRMSSITPRNSWPRTMLRMQCQATPQRKARTEWPRPARPTVQPDFDELEKEVDQLSNRAAAVNSGLDRLQQQQAASGYGLRGDMVERQASLKSNLYKAEEAMQHRDASARQEVRGHGGKRSGSPGALPGTLEAV